MTGTVIPIPLASAQAQKIDNKDQKSDGNIILGQKVKMDSNITGVIKTQTRPPVPMTSQTNNQQQQQQAQQPLQQQLQQPQAQQQQQQKQYTTNTVVPPLHDPNSLPNKKETNSPPVSPFTTSDIASAVTSVANLISSNTSLAPTNTNLVPTNANLVVPVVPKKSRFTVKTIPMVEVCYQSLVDVHVCAYRLMCVSVYMKLIYFIFIILG